MRNLSFVVALLLILGFVVYMSCSAEERNEAIARVAEAGKVLNGDVRPNDVEHDVPNIVAEQKRKERVRQNTSWTAENRALHPIEYCQAQLEELKTHAASLTVSEHEVATKKAEVSRLIGDNEGVLKQLESFVAEAKAAYRTCEANNAWPAEIGGFSLSREKVQERIVESVRKMQSITTRLGTLRNQLTLLEKRAALVADEQKKLILLRERVEATISDLKLKKVLDDDQGISDNLNAINDAMGTLGVDYDSPTLNDLMTPGHSTEIESEFEKIMAE